jgi:hypothetical protein
MTVMRKRGSQERAWGQEALEWTPHAGERSNSMICNMDDKVVGTRRLHIVTAATNRQMRVDHQAEDWKIDFAATGTSKLHSFLADTPYGHTREGVACITQHSLPPSLQLIPMRSWQGSISPARRSESMQGNKGRWGPHTRPPSRV